MILTMRWEGDSNDMRNATHICKLRNIINLVARMVHPSTVRGYVTIEEPNATKVRDMTVHLNWLLSELVQINLLQTIPELKEKVTGLESTVQHLQQSIPELKEKVTGLDSTVQHLRQSITDLNGRIPSSDTEAKNKKPRSSWFRASDQQDLLCRLRSLNEST
jgi:FtsZ-binding cell division protein ZapB